MRENLTSLASELRKETCPPRVFAEVKRRTVAALTPGSNRVRFAICGIAAIILFSTLGVWRWYSGRMTGTATQVSAATAGDRAEIARQTAAALELVGTTLVDAGERSGEAILNQAVPPLRNSLETASKKTIHRLKL